MKSSPSDRYRCPRSDRMRALADVDALLFACIHRTGHANAPYHVPGTDELAGDRLIWLYDIHLLFSRMSAAEQAEFAVRAAEKKIRAICRDALQRSAECFATAIPAAVRGAIPRPRPGGSGLPHPIISAAFRTAWSHSDELRQLRPFNRQGTKMELRSQQVCL